MLFSVHRYGNSEICLTVDADLCAVRDIRLTHFCGIFEFSPGNEVFNVFKYLMLELISANLLSSSEFAEFI